jgi:prepilin-type N-terminal cleavage/methylation domain-containing protein
MNVNIEPLSSQGIARMNINLFKTSQLKRGFTLIELVIIMAILGIFTMFAIVAMGDADEQKDVRAFNTVQATLQSVVLQGAERTNSQPNELSAATVIAAMPPHRYIGLTKVNDSIISASTNRGRLRTVEFTTNTCGDVCMTSLTGFTAFSLKPLPKQDCKAPAPSVAVTPCNYLAGS